MSYMTSAEWGVIFASVIVIAIVMCWIGKRIDAQSSQVHRPALIGVTGDFAGYTDWFPPHIKPVHVGRYYVRLPLNCKACAMADWDGEMWRDPTNGYECYFQQVEWLGLIAKGEQ